MPPPPPPPTTLPTLLLSDGRRIPQIGLGVYQSRPGTETYQAVLAALRLGYRHIDTATIYRNEGDVGRAIRDSKIPREQLWITTKLWNTDQGYYEKVSQACTSSLQKLGLTYIDLYLLHAPVEGVRLESWKALERLQAEGKVRSIGVSNYNVHHLQELLACCKVRPVTNQLEVSPYLTRAAIMEFCQANNILVSAYASLTKGVKLKDPKLVQIAEKYDGRTTAQILLRWAIEHNFVILPKSVHEPRIQENLDVFGFSLRPEDMKTLDSMNENLVTGWDPTTWK